MDLTGKLEPLTIEILVLVTECASKLNIPFMVVGATARDIILEHAYNIPTGRATKDLDIAIMVSNWALYGDLKTKLVSTGKFRADNKITHRIHFGGLPIDIVPFGPIEEKDNTISWPSDHEKTMNVAGFQEALGIAIEVEIDPDFSIKVASPDSIVALKIFAWNDRKQDKDINDFMVILKNYLDIGNGNRLHSEHADLVDDDFDYVTTGARLLGRDISTFLGRKAKESLISILDKGFEESDHTNIVNMMTASGDRMNDTFEENINLVKALIRGIKD